MNNWTKSARIAFIGIWGVLLLSLGALVANSSPTSAAPPAQGSPPGSSLWRDVSETAVRGQGTRWIIPVKYRLLAADIVALDNLLGQAPLENSLSTQSVEVLLTLPVPDGSFGRFRLEEAPMMEPALAAKFPEIKTYRGWGLDDPTATAYLDRTPAGFHGMILSSSDTVYIDPYQQGDITHYLSYFKQDYGNIWGKSFQEEGFEPAESPRSQNVSSAANSGPTLHTYRLAMAATAEYTQFHGTVASALAAINTTMNRVNGIYQREVSIRMILIANTDQLIYTDGVTDPYTNDDGGAMLDENQGNVDAVIGSANYDIGHVFSTGGGGVASLESPCWNLAKAHGVTGSPAPVGDPFDVDFVAHEMGHQFGGNHTFNSGNAGSCAGGNRNGPTAYEPGSGTTIMAYAGICSPQDLQPNSDDNFHGISFDEITAYVTNPTPGFGGSCGAHTATGNAAPTVNAGLNTTIPISTPFTLTGSATDPNGDTLTYQWEEFDLGNAWTINAVLPNNDSSGARPIFRSYKPVSSPARIFPAPANILNGSLFNIGEALPSINRTMTFRLTARDNKGGVNNDAMNVSVTNTSGPFRVTAPLTGTTWTSATLQTVSWNVANTTAAPVSCTNVNILFSSDDGSNFGNTLLANTPNDGTETITAPILGTSNGRVKVTCSGNIFFHISGRITLIGNTPINTYLPFILRNN